MVVNVGLDGLGQLGAFGTPSTYQPGVECPAKGSWEDWCDCVFQPGSENHGRCRSKPMGLLTAAPWTDIGAGQRGIPKPGSIVAAVVQTVTGAPPPAPVEPVQPAPPPVATPEQPRIVGQEHVFRRPIPLVQPPARATKGMSPWAWAAVGVGALGLAMLLVGMKKR